MLIVCGACFGISLRCATAAAESAAATAGKSWPVDDHTGFALDDHLFVRPAAEIDQRCLAADHVAVFTAAAALSRHGIDVCDSGNACYSDVRAIHVHASGTLDIGVIFADFVRVNGRGNLTDFVEADFGDGIEKAGINFQAFRINYFRAGWNRSYLCRRR